MKQIVKVKILHLPLKAKWFNMQERGEKTEEYREIKPYWCNRLARCDKQLCWMRDYKGACRFRHQMTEINRQGYTHVCLRYGYTDRMIVNKIDSITIGRGKVEWGAPEDRDVFIIKHHKEESPIVGKNNL